MKRSFRRLIILSIVFVVTGIGALVTVLNKYSTGNKSDAVRLAIADTMLVQKVIFQNATATPQSLTKAANGGWVINEKYKVRKQLIDLMLVGVSRLEEKRPVSEENKAKVIEELKKSGVKVSVVQEGKTETFYVKTNDNDPNSSYFLKENSTEPKVVYVPGFTGDITNLFVLSESDWRSKELFASTPRSLQSVKVTYQNKHAENNFEIGYKNNSFEVLGVERLDSNKLFEYLTIYQQVNVDNFVVDKKDSILNILQKEEPEAVIQVKDIHPGRSKTLKIYAENKEVKGFYGIVEEDNEVVVFKPQNIMRLLVRKSYFSKS
ncbi:MAG TPA: DUF4340 domain-containing protein [Cytophagaceae bacterium]